MGLITRLKVCWAILTNIRGTNDSAYSIGYRYGMNDQAVSGLYTELLHAVHNKVEGETRHQTALRHITHSESPTTGAGVSNG